MREEKGSAMIEAAFIIPVFLYLAFAAIEFSLIFFYSFVLESAMYDATRYAKIAVDRDTQIQQVRDLIGQRSYGMIPPEQVLITTDIQVNVAKNWQNAPPEQCAGPYAGNVCPDCGNPQIWDDSNNNGLCDIGPPPLELQAPGSLVAFTAFYKKPIYTPFMDFLANTPDGAFAIISSTVIRNEPN